MYQLEININITCNVNELQVMRIVLVNRGLLGADSGPLFLSVVFYVNRFAVCTSLSLTFNKQ